METPKMKLTKEQLKSIIKEELGKIMDEKIELGNYKDRVDKAAAEKELKKKQSICAQLDSKIHDYNYPEELPDGRVIYKYSKEEYEQFMKARKEAGCEELDKERKKQLAKDVKAKYDYQMRLNKDPLDALKGPLGRRSKKENIQRMVQEELEAVTKGN